jgi:hypothetical protein
METKEGVPEKSEQQWFEETYAAYTLEELETGLKQIKALVRNEERLFQEAVVRARSGLNTTEAQQRAMEALIERKKTQVE